MIRNNNNNNNNNNNKQAAPIYFTEGKELNQNDNKSNYIL